MIINIPLDRDEIETSSINFALKIVLLANFNDVDSFPVQDNVDGWPLTIDEDEIGIVVDDGGSTLFTYKLWPGRIQFHQWERGNGREATTLELNLPAIDDGNVLQSLIDFSEQTID